MKHTHPLSLVLALSLAVAPLGAQAGLVRKLILGGVVATVGHAAIKKNSEAKPLPGKPVKNHAAYLAEHQRRHKAVIAAAATRADIRAIPEDVRGSQCVAAATYTLLGKGYSSYGQYVQDLKSNGYFNGKPEDGISIESARYLLTQAGYPNEYFPVELTNNKLVTRMADSLDAGKAVFLRVDAVKAYELETKQPAPLNGVADTVMTDWVGGQHMLRVTAVNRDDQGRPSEFGVYDVNAPDRSATLTGKEMLELLDNAKIGTAFRRGAIITQTSVFPAIKL